MSEAGCCDCKHLRGGWLTAVATATDGSGRCRLSAPKAATASASTAASAVVARKINLAMSRSSFLATIINL